MLGKLRAAASELGVFNALLYGIDRALAYRGWNIRIFRYRLVAQPVQGHSSLPNGRGRSIIVREIAAGDSVLEQTILAPAVLNHRFRQGALCLGAFREGTLVGYLWLRLGPFLEDEVRCHFVPLPEGQAAWDFDIFIRPEFRSSIVFAKLWDAAMVFLHSRGVKWSMSRISAFNPISLTSHRRLGATCTGTAIFLRLGQWQVLIATRKPFFHVSLGPANIPRLTVRSPRS